MHPIITMRKTETGYEVECNGYLLSLNDRRILNNGKQVKKRWHLVSLMQNVDLGVYTNLQAVKKYVHALVLR